MPRTPKPTKEERANMTHDELLRSVWLLDEVIESLRWVPVSERLPVRKEYLGSNSRAIYMKCMEIAYMTDTLEYKIGYYDGYKWMDKRLEKIVNVVAWKIHDPFKPNIEILERLKQ
ncbi:hypothetical protein [uncultured Robinsoniella sp.]|uniref:hypothetical protein n=1 Tax=uncultured Robinsoniella sp. TaxID=904190 RepID=UPI00206FD241|nr:MAG TPA: hypothetical protein [Caudoviricetes sp.]